MKRLLGGFTKMENYQQASEGIAEQLSIGTIHHNLSDLMPASSEVGNLWSAYAAESMTICFLKKWVNDSTDPEIHAFLQSVLDTSTQRVQDMENLFKSVDYLVPLAFGENDVYVDAPKLFSESFTCLYTRVMQKMIMHHYLSGATSSYRSDFRNFYSGCLKSSDDLHRRATDILLAKGILQKHPSIITPKTLEKVEDNNYFGSYFPLFGDNRTLNAIEIGHIYTMMEIKQLIRTYNVGYSQVVKSDKIRAFLLKAKEIADKHLEVLGHFLTEQDIPRPTLSEILITDTKEAELTDKLILTHSVATTAYISTGFGLAIPNMSRKDLTATMLRFMSEVLGLAKDGGELMIEERWLERIPETANRKELVQ